MVVRYDTRDPANWALVDDRESVAVPSGIPGRFIPISPYLTLVTSYGRAILVQAVSNSAKPNWFTGGWIYQINQSNTSSPTDPPRTICEKAYKFYLNNRTFISFPEDLSPYVLRISIPRWIQDIRVTIWEYEGTTRESCDEKLDTIKLDLVRIEKKIDDCCGEKNTVPEQQLTVGRLFGFI